MAFRGGLAFALEFSLNKRSLFRTPRPFPAFTISGSLTC
jgi:hypothetical protein